MTVTVGLKSTTGDPLAQRHTYRFTAAAAPAQAIFTPGAKLPPQGYGLLDIVGPGDLDGDGDLDLLGVHRKFDPDNPDYTRTYLTLLVNQGDGQYLPSTTSTTVGY